MIPAPTPPNERQRLATLRPLKILDTPSEERFDRVTRLARRVFNVPIALVSLIDANRQWFKSKQGFEACETGREESFCGHAIMNDELMVVENALEDPRFSDNPFVTGPPHLRFYAGHPLSAPDGSKLGTLCVIDDKSRKLTPEDRRTLMSLGRIIEAELVALDLSTTDALTKLSNLRGFLEIGKYLLLMATRLRHQVQAVYVRVGGIGKFNKQQGSSEGDRALVEVADVLQASFRESDLIGRIGGDEFCILLPSTPDRLTETPLQRLSENLKRTNSQRGPDERLSMAVATVTFNPERHQELEDLMVEAERKLNASLDKDAPQSR